MLCRTKKNVGRIKNGERIADKLSLRLHLWLDEKKGVLCLPSLVAP